ncbi:MarR family transcriptional regulator [Amycolatopsis alkalitolerans]|uniref:MarR family transcriptional regulator n=1 Tax=Amycolatopsis alkalitolerans TaxID=2547244 RepID=A0A5C4MBE0_9PSEU|nr:helix-turn-helix domain-containing protein [Amycolatopsis alkalitolerans]TNC29590.1 MarR family transcriptional regulator [Amycolatopsis alkalitolerans]
MDGGQLHRLGRRLIELSAAATGQPGDLELTPGERAVLEDVIRHPGGSVGEIRERTGFVQSHVSASVARLRERGLITTAADPRDGRRTRVRVTDRTSRAITRRAGRRIDNAVASAVADRAQAARALVLLDELARLLL